MCGIFGGWILNLSKSFEQQVSTAMQTLKHRGPDKQGYEIIASPHGQTLLGHTRLSIIDLSEHGHQPMHSADKRYSIIFNGEIYNYCELKETLYKLGHQFHTNTDTEVLLIAWRQWGEACLNKLIGMFAFVIYDKLEQTLTCVRDAFGIKPFFYTINESQFLFASEQPALIALRGEKTAVDLQRSYDYLVYADYDSQELTFIEGIKHLLPGHILKFNLATGKSQAPLSWWTPKTTLRNDLSFNQATEMVREQFLDNIRLHLRSDVPLGAALSGGIDSSAVVCAMRHLEPDANIHTFSYIAEGTDLSEEIWVDRVNQHTKAIPHKFVATGAELARDLDSMILAQGEPFGSTSIYAQYRVFQLAKQSGITVSLDGQGADELLAGYQGYPAERLLSLLENKNLKDAFRFAKHWSQWPDRNYLHALMNLGQMFLPDFLHQQAGRLVGRHASPSWLNISLLKEQGLTLQENRVNRDKSAKGRRVVERLSYALKHRGLSELLRHGDRNSMHFSIESRVPFLTTPMADLLLSLPENYLISHQGETKHVFREAMRNIVPDEILDRRDKIGFATPEKDWLLNMAPTIRDWLKSSQNISFLHADRLIDTFNDVVSGKKPFNWQIWRWVNFVRWHENFIQKAA